MSDSKTYTIKLPTREEAFEMNQRAHAERLQAATEKAQKAGGDLCRMLTDDAIPMRLTCAIAALIDARIELALLERGGG